MATQLATTDENPLKKFDAPVLKNMGNMQLDAAAPRAMFMPTNMGEAMELAKLMAASNFVPPHLRGKAGDCLAVVMQAGRWAMDPFAVGNKSYFVNDRIAYESQLVHAVINSSGVLDGKLVPEWQGEGDKLECTVRGKLKGAPDVLSRTVRLRTITTRNSPLWKQDPEQQLAYYATRAWVRLHAPEVLLGVYTPDELSSAISVAGVADGGNAVVQQLSAAMLAAPVDDASHEGEANSDPEPEGPADADRGERLTLDQAMAEIDRCETVIDINAKLEAALPDLTDEEYDELRAHAGVRKTELGAK